MLMYGGKLAEVPVDEESTGRLLRPQIQSGGRTGPMTDHHVCDYNV